MASRCIQGKPGGGKSQLAVKWLLEELLTTQRVIVTNLALDLEGIVAYTVKKNRTDIDVYSRIRLLPEDAIRDFWRYRSSDPANDHAPISDSDIAAGVRPDPKFFAGGGVAYYLDEFHRYFNSRQWKNTGPLVLDYISMHRHYGDDVVWITQAPKNVDSQWRSVTQDVTLVRNLSKEAWRGFVKGTKFTWFEYLDFPDDAGTLTPQTSGEWKIQKDVVACYHTSAVGGAADIGKKRKGIHIYWMFGGIIAVMLLVALIFMKGPTIITGWLMKKSPPPGAQKSLQDPRHVVSAPLETPNLQGVPSPTETPKPMHIITVELKYATAASVMKALSDRQASLEVGVGVVASNDNVAITLSGTDEQAILTYAEMIRQFDVQSAVVVIHCLVASSVVTKTNQVGLFSALQAAAQSSSSSQSTGTQSAAFGVSIASLLSSMSYNLQTGLATLAGQWTAQLALQTLTAFVSGDSRFRVMSHPTLTVLSGRSASFSSGRQIPIPQTTVNLGTSQSSIQYENAVFSFKVQPTVNRDGSISVQIGQSDSEVLQTVVIQGNDVPELSTQTMDTEITLQANQLVYLGGMRVSSTNKQNTGTPYLRKIPVVNWVLGSSNDNIEDDDLFVVLSAEVFKGRDYPIYSEKPSVRRARKL